MGAIVILMGLGICVFLLWFFDAVVRDLQAEGSSEYRYTKKHYDLRGDLHSDDTYLYNRMP